MCPQVYCFNGEMQKGLKALGFFLRMRFSIQGGLGGLGVWGWLIGGSRVSKGTRADVVHRQKLPGWTGERGVLVS